MGVYILGIDEAGRGPVLGPLVLGAVSFPRSSLEQVEVLGAKDSKKLTSKKRKILCGEIRRQAAFASIFSLSPQRIDSSTQKLNELEYEGMAALVQRFLFRHESIKQLQVFIDAVGSPETVLRYLKGKILSKRISFHAQYKADQEIPIVAAASIVAKNSRDCAVESLAFYYGILGSGYPSDPKTKAWLREESKKGKFPSFVRHSWATAKKLLPKMDKGPE